MSEKEHSAPETVSGKAALLQRFRLPLMIGGLAVGMIVFLLIGVGLGKVKLGLERKQFAEQAVQFKARLAEVENEKKLYEVKAEGLKKEADKQKSRADELDIKLTELTLSLQKAESALASATAAAPVKVAASASKTREYVRFGNVDCTLTTGKGSNNWKDCLQQGRPQTPAKAVVAVPAKTEEKHAPAAPKTVESHAKAAH